jgi:hypothetical protein
MRAAGDNAEAVRLRCIVVVLWRAGLRISEALALNETDLDPVRGSLLVRHGKGDKRREVGMIAGRGRTSTRGSNSGESYRSAGCSAWCAVRLAGGHARQPESAPNCTTPLLWPVFGVGSRHTSSGTRTRSRCHGRGFRCW